MAQLFRLRAAEIQQRPIGRAVATVPDDGFMARSCSMRTIIVEDHLEVAAQLRLSVEELGHPVVGQASSFAAAVDLLTAVPGIELAFIDLCLGADADASFGAVLVDLAASREIQVVVTTALSSIPDRLKGAALLVKPFSGEQLASVLASLAPRETRHDDMLSRPRA
jgi:CheY-like chemotaxis protein